MTREERDQLIEWLYISTPYSRKFWEKCSDKQLKDEYIDQVLERTEEE